MCQRHSLCTVFLKFFGIAKAIAEHWSGNEKRDVEWSAYGGAYIQIELKQHFYRVIFLLVFWGRGWWWWLGVVFAVVPVRMHVGAFPLMHLKNVLNSHLNDSASSSLIRAKPKNVV